MHEEILKHKYYATKYGGEKEESFKELCQRVSRGYCFR
jgi:hypothetical protein